MYIIFPSLTFLCLFIVVYNINNLDNILRQTNRRVHELAKALKDKDDLIAQLNERVAGMKKTYEVKLDIAYKEITVLKENLCAVKKVKEINAKNGSKGSAALLSSSCSLTELQIEIEKVKRHNKVLQIQNEEYKKKLSSILYTAGSGLSVPGKSSGGATATATAAAIKQEARETIVVPSLLPMSLSPGQVSPSSSMSTGYNRNQQQKYKNFR